jgi:hypothetical protein
MNFFTSTCGKRNIKSILQEIELFGLTMVSIRVIIWLDYGLHVFELEVILNQFKGSYQMRTSLAKLVGSIIEGPSEPL